MQATSLLGPDARLNGSSVGFSGFTFHNLKAEKPRELDTPTAQMTSDPSITHKNKASLKVDKDGLPLIPQPSASPLDPLNYPNWLKYWTLLELSLLAFVSSFTGAIINPAVPELAHEFGISPHVATYQSTAYIGLSAVVSLILIPFANAYGHRMIFILASFLTAVFLIIAAESTSFGMLIIFRGLSAFHEVNIVLGVAAIPNIFFVDQRGRATGFYIFVHQLLHLSPVIGGYISFRLGWRWTLRFGAILQGFMVSVLIVLLPDTLFQRPDTNVTLDVRHDLMISDTKPYQPPRMALSTYLRCLRLVDPERMPKQGVRFSDIFLRPLRLLRYPSILLPALSNAVVTSFGTYGPSVIGPSQFTEIFKFNSAQNGLATGLSIVIGSFIGELLSGWVTDLLIRRARAKASKSGEVVQAELRLRGFWLGAVIVPLGLLMFGFTIQYADTPIAPCIAIGFTSIGAQIVTGVCYAYSCNDCYPMQSSDISQIFSFFKALFTLSLTFYEVPLARKIGYQWAFTAFALFCVIIFSGVVTLVFKGAKWRENAPNMPS
ncbi:hypothetical protein D9756_005552 [Leucocoprinus leucothites]|uniref:Major facilitator superfamily (MFS) profile domain-containing protein n=1 Tax=Leucocoprinus leucothites TaxID=201217 RepID=A0A8H5D7V0_9AGAR|nr:hypothetical protein D9756_005552 [Leucoagaricus leucothites]